MTTYVGPMGKRENNWLEIHEGHADANYADGGDTQFGELPDYDLGRGRGKPRVFVQVLHQSAVEPSTRDNSFVTMRDQVSKVHPWLI